MGKPITCHSRDARKHFAQREYSPRQSFIVDLPEDPDDIQRHVLLEEVHRKIREDATIWKCSETTPIKILSRVSWMSERRGFKMGGGGEYWLYKNRLYTEVDGLDFTDDQKELLVLEEFDKERKQFEKLQAKFSGIPNETLSRSKIPSNVRIFVWQRDSGKCVECGSNENLEYDHIIPFIKGGSNTERNLQLLCGNCNRLKSDNIQ